MAKEKPGTNSTQLTPREMEVMHLIADGNTNPQIADTLCISTNTVHNHRVSIFQKLKAHNVATMIKAAREKGLIDD